MSAPGFGIAFFLGFAAVALAFFLAGFGFGLLDSPGIMYRVLIRHI
jgi:hypothetical protein